MREVHDCVVDARHLARDRKALWYIDSTCVSVSVLLLAEAIDLSAIMMALIGPWKTDLKRAHQTNCDTSCKCSELRPSPSYLNTRVRFRN